MLYFLKRIGFFIILSNPEGMIIFLHFIFSHILISFFNIISELPSFGWSPNIVVITFKFLDFICSFTSFKSKNSSIKKYYENKIKKTYIFEIFK